MKNKEMTIVVVEGGTSDPTLVNYDNVIIAPDGTAKDLDTNKTFIAGTYLTKLEFLKLVQPVKKEAIRLAVKHAKELYGKAGH